MPPIEPSPLLPKTVSLDPPVGVRVSTTTDNLKRLNRAEKCVVQWNQGGFHEGLKMIGLANRVRTTT